MQKSRQIEAIYPLSPMQQGMLFHTIYAPQSGVYFHQVKCVFEGELDASSLQQAWQRVLDRHPILRTAFVWEHRKQPLQVVHPQVLLPWWQEDWRGASPSAQRERLEAYLERDRESGFVLSKAPLMRCALLRTGDHLYEFIWSYHHILLDGWSIALLFKEVFTHYAAFQKREPLELSRPRPFQDYIAWLKRQDLAEAESFWRNSLRGFTVPTPLGLGRQSNSNGDGNDYGQVQVELSSELTAALNSLAAQHQLTVNTVVQGGWALLLNRYSGERDVVYGATVSGRPAELAGIETMIGLFINTLPVRVRVSGRELLTEWLKGIQGHQVESRQYEFSPLIEVQGWSEVPRKLPLFGSLYIYENYVVEALAVEDFGNLRVRDVRAIERTNYPLTLMVWQGQRLLLKLFYDCSRFDSADVSRMLDHLRTLLENMVADPHCRVSELDLLTPAERERLTAWWDDAETEDYSQTRLHRLFESQVEQTPLAPALVSEQATLSYAELNCRANQLAHHLRSLGVGPEVIVGVCLPRSAEMVVALLGILKAGGAYLPLDPAYPSQRLSFMVRDSKMRVLLTETGLWETPAAEAVQVVYLDGESNQITEEQTDNPISEVSGENLAYVIYTSGSTGTPKGVQIPHAAVINLLLSMSRQPGLDATDSLLAVTTLSFDIAALEIFLPLITGARLVLASRETAADAEQLSSALERYQVTAMQATPATWRMLIEAGWQGRAGLKVLCGGEVLSRALAEELLSRSAEVWNVYGPTETTIWSAIWRANWEVVRQGNPPIGKPIARTQLYVLDEHAHLVPEGVAGELYIGGLGLARGYAGRADLTAERFVPNPYNALASARMYRTGDLVRRLPDGEIEYIARVDNQVKVRGFRIELGEIEAALEAHSSVGEAVVTVREDLRGDRRLVAYVVPRQGSVEAGSGIVPQLRAHLGELLPDHMLPSAYMMMERLPLTSNGKVDRKALPAPDDARPELAQTYVPARTATEELIIGVWEEVLGIERIGIDDDFFDLGGHSLLAMQVISRLRDAFKVELPLRLLFSKPTIRALAKGVEEESQTGRALATPPIEILSREEKLPLSFAQQRLWFLDQMEPGNPFYNLGGAVRLRGPLHIPALKRSLDEMLRRHEVLRTSFEGTGEDVRQVVASAAKLRLPIVDLKQLEPDKCETEIRRLAVVEAQLPFDLSRGPLLRATLLRLAEEEHVMLLTMHHIVGDEWSIGLLIKEISISYEAFSGGKPSLLPELKIQYADYAGWQQRWWREEIMETLLAYWRKQLDGAPLVLDLPADRARPPVQSYQGATYEFELGTELTARIKALSRQQGTTLFMTLLAGFQALLYRYTGQGDFVIGTPVANRSRKELEPLIGFFVNLLVLRSELTVEMTFADHLMRVREMALDAYAHQDFPFEQLVEELQPERDLSRSPVFQVLFALQNAPTEVLSTDLAGVELSVMEIERGISRYDLGVSVMETNGSLCVAFEYNTQLFAASRMMRMAGHYVKLLESIVAEPQQTVAQVELIGEEERRRLLIECNQTARSYSSEACVHELVDQQAESRPTALALTYEETQMTFGELNQRANRLAHYLQRLGVAPEVMVGICVERSLDWVVALLAILKAGGAYVALDPSYPAERLSYMLQDSSVPVLVTQERLKQMLASSTQAQLVCLDTDWEHFAEESDLNLEPRAHAGNLAYVTYTSGSTGKPKAVMTTHGSLLNLVFSHRRYFEVTSEDRSPQFAQMGFDASVWELWTYLTAGASVHLADDETRLSPARLREWFVEKQITIGWLPPVLAETVLDDNWPEQLRLRLLITGSDKARRHPPPSLPFGYVNSYGPTEATVIVTWGAVPLKSNSDSAPLIGRPIDNTQIYMLDRQLRPVPIGIPGELCIGGVSLGRGYLNCPDLTAEKFVPDAFGPVQGMRLYRTGDLARYQEDGNIEFLGRIDDQVKVRGFRIELGEIETVLAEHPDVRTALVLVNEDSTNDKRLIAYVVPQQQSADVAWNYSYELTSRLAQYLREKLPAYMVPAAFVLLEEMPLSPNGKLNRRLLPAPDENGLIASETYVDPRTPAEQTLADIFKMVLNVEGVGVYDNFFELGGHSILATQVVSRIREQFDVELSLRSFFTSPTVAGVAEMIESNSGAQSGAQGPPIKPVSRVGPFPLSFAQQGLWLTDQLAPGSTAYNAPLAVRFSGSLNVEVLRRTLNEIVRRHEVLRTTFAEVGGKPQQIIAPPSEVSVPLTDLCEFGVEEQEAALRRHIDYAVEERFDLSCGPLLKAEMLKMAEDEHVLILNMHHIITDRWSLGVLVNEVGALYETFATGRESPLADLPIQYADYAVWQREQLQGEVLEELLDYWRVQLAGAPSVLELPAAYSHTAEQTFSASVPFVLTPQLTAALKEISQREGATLFMTLLACWQLLLARYTGQEDIVVGSPIANRTRTGVEELIGLFVNMLVLRTHVSGELTFLELLRRVREVCLGAYAHQDLPFERLVEELQPERQLSHAPLFQVLFQLQNVPQDFKVPELKLRVIPIVLGEANVDLTLSMAESEGVLFGEFIYSQNLFSETILRMERQWRGLLESIVENPECPISALAIDAEQESAELIDSFNEELEV
jgi:amino acid adenylation domain-containing protein